MSASVMDPRTVVVMLDDTKAGQGLAELRGQLGRALASGDARFVVDVAGLARVSSGVVAALLWAKRRCAVRGVEVVVRGANPASLDLLTRTGLCQLLEVEPLPGRRSP